MSIGPRTCIFLSLSCAIFLTANSFAAVNAKRSAACKVSPDFDPETNLHAVDDYKTVVQLLFLHDDYEAIDCIADSARLNKEKFKGGMWKLHNIYAALDRPKGHATEEDWSDHFKRVNQWISAKPDSITARVVLAESYSAYAWNARGDGLSGTVTDSGWRLFGERLDQAESTLQQAKVRKTKCPEWYVAMQDVALGKGWDVVKATALLQDAIAFEPDYYYFYRMHAFYLLPKWNGKEGDSEKFIAAAADRVGGQKGDILYFQVASYLLCHCSTDDLKAVSWPRMKKGFAALEQQDGISLQTLNEFAYLAVRKRDVIVANDALVRIGDDWSEDPWRTERYFVSSRKWIQTVLPGAVREKNNADSAEANMQTAVGLAFAKEFENKYGDLIQKCLVAGGNENGVSDILFSVGIMSGKGYVSTFLQAPSDSFTICFWDQFHHQAAGFLAPPTDNYWFKVPISAMPIAKKE